MYGNHPSVKMKEAYDDQMRPTGGEGIRLAAHRLENNKALCAPNTNDYLEPEKRQLL